MGNCTGQTTQFLQQQKLPKTKQTKTKQKDGEETDKRDLKTYHQMQVWALFGSGFNQPLKRESMKQVGKTGTFEH